MTKNEIFQFVNKLNSIDIPAMLYRETVFDIISFGKSSKIHLAVTASIERVKRTLKEYNIEDVTNEKDTVKFTINNDTIFVHSIFNISYDEFIQNMVATNLTFNSLLMKPDGQIYDMYGGLADLRNKNLTFVKSFDNIPQTHLTLNCIRYIFKNGFTFDEQVKQYISATLPMFNKNEKTNALFYVAEALMNNPSDARAQLVINNEFLKTEKHNNIDITDYRNVIERVGITHFLYILLLLLGVNANKSRFSNIINVENFNDIKTSFGLDLNDEVIYYRLKEERGMDYLSTIISLQKEFANITKQSYDEPIYHKKTIFDFLASGNETLTIADVCLLEEDETHDNPQSPAIEKPQKSSKSAELPIFVDPVIDVQITQQEEQTATDIELFSEATAVNEAMNVSDTVENAPEEKLIKDDMSFEEQPVDFEAKVDEDGMHSPNSTNAPSEATKDDDVAVPEVVKEETFANHEDEEDDEDDIFALLNSEDDDKDIFAETKRSVNPNFTAANNTVSPKPANEGLPPQHNTESTKCDSENTETTTSGEERHLESDVGDNDEFDLSIMFASSDEQMETASTVSTPQPQVSEPPAMPSSPIEQGDDTAAKRRQSRARQAQKTPSFASKFACNNPNKRDMDTNETSAVDFEFTTDFAHNEPVPTATQQQTAPRLSAKESLINTIFEEETKVAPIELPEDFGAVITAVEEEVKKEALEAQKASSTDGNTEISQGQPFEISEKDLEAILDELNGKRKNAAFLDDDEAIGEEKDEFILGTTSDTFSVQPTTSNKYDTHQVPKAQPKTDSDDFFKSLNDDFAEIVGGN